MVSFLAGGLNELSKHMHMQLNEGDKVREYYSCLKLMIHVHFFNQFPRKHVPLKGF